ncbi:MAG: polysaccharide biosynthesis tyrosine autokinase [Dysgonamonadaceae bacterium]|jgi:capsular exopolysaccharide synthesis family protein|nr:polysaccharide biosynthesis tyrosine autokinase [Dysgonamonadaceae bacterium]
MEDNFIQNPVVEDDNTQLIETVFHYVSYWKLFLVSVIVCLVAAFLYLRYTTTSWKVSSKVLISAGKNAPQAGDINAMAFSDLGVMMPVNNTMENEVAVLLSRSLRQEVADSLHLNISYFKEGKIKNAEIYRKTPLTVSIPNVTHSGSFIVSREKDNSLTLKSNEPDFSTKVQLDSAIATPWGMATFSENPFGLADYPIKITVGMEGLPRVDAASQKTSNIVDISTISTVPEKGQDIVNTLVAIYNKNAINEKNYVAQNTSDFIKQRLIDISQDLETAEKNVEDFKKSQGISDISSQQQMLLTSSGEYDKKINDNEIQLDLLRSTKNYLLNPDNSGKVVPVNIGLTDPTIISQLRAYNDEVMARQKNSDQMKGDHPLLKKSDEQIALLKNNLLNGIGISESTLNFTLRELNRQNNMYLGLSRNLTAQERENRELYRKQSIKEQIYIYLSQKLEEIGLTLVQAAPNAKIIDPAAEKYAIVNFPKPMILMLAALILGLFIPIAYIYIRDLLDNKVHTKDDIMRVVKAPFLGDIPALKNPEAFPVLKQRSSVAEKFRVVTSNLEFISGGAKPRIIQITSSTSDEGKSFFARNLALSLATTGKKTLLIDMDMRKSVMKKFIDLKVKSGLAVFLSNPDTKFESIVDKSGTFDKNLDIIPVMVYPPNPAELLASDRLNLLFSNIGNKYDYVIIDSAPVGLVADAYRINQFTTATIYLTRANYTLKRSLQEIRELYGDKKLNNIACVLNAATVSKRYGYGYGEYKHKYYTED